MNSTIPATASQETGLRLTGPQVFAVLLIPAVWLIDTTIMAPALGPIAQANPSASSFWINVIFSIPYVTSLIFSAVSGRLSRRIDKKALTVIGLVIYGVSGIIPAFGGTLLEIFFLRLITGIGLGLALPMPNVYISDHYVADKREKMLGYANVVAQAANIAVLLVAGQLINLGWRDTFYAYALVLVIAAINLVWLPKSRRVASTAPQVPAAIPRQKLQVSSIAGIAVAMTVIYIVFAIAAANISEFVVASKVASVSMIGYIATAPAVGNIIGSFLSERLRRILKSWLAFASVVLMAIGFLVYSVASDWLAVVAATGIIGVGVGLLTPYLLNLTVQKVSPLQKGLALGIVSGCITFGVLLFPYVQQLIAYIASDQDLKFLFTVVYALAFAAAAILLIAGAVRHSTRKSADRVAMVAPYRAGSEL